MVMMLVGSLVTAKRDMNRVAQKGEQGICYEVYRLGDRLGWSVLFERGGHDGFSPDEAEICLQPQGFCEPLSGYVFTSVLRLQYDYRRGLFNRVWASHPRAQ